MQTELLFPELKKILIEDKDDNEDRNKESNYNSLKGALAELLFDCLGIIKKWQVSRPTSSFLKYDRVIIINGEHKKIQIKTGSDVEKKNGKIYNQTIISRNRSSKRYRGRYLKYQKGDYDLLFIASKNYCWLIPFEVIENKTCLNLYNHVWDEFKIYKTNDIFKML